MTTSGIDRVNGHADLRPALPPRTMDLLRERNEPGK